MSLVFFITTALTFQERVLGVPTRENLSAATLGLNKNEKECKDETCWCKLEVLAAQQDNPGTPRICESYKISVGENQICVQTDQGCLTMEDILHLQEKIHLNEKKNLDICCIIAALKKHENPSVCSSNGTLECYYLRKQPECRCPVGSKGPNCNETNSEEVGCYCFYDHKTYRPPHPLFVDKKLVECNSANKTYDDDVCQLKIGEWQCICERGKSSDIDLPCSFVTQTESSTEPVSAGAPYVSHSLAYNLVAPLGILYFIT